MAELIQVDAGGPDELRTALARALDGGPALGFGMLGDAPAQVPDGTAVVIATSGSSGVPKRVVLSGEALRAGAEATAARIGSGRWLLALPTGYVAGLQVLVRSLLAGTDPVSIEGRFSADSFARATLPMVGTQPLLTSLVPAQLATLLDAQALSAQARARAEALAFAPLGRSPLLDRVEPGSVGTARAVAELLLDAYLDLAERLPGEEDRARAQVYAAELLECITATRAERGDAARPD